MAFNQAIQCVTGDYPPNAGTWESSTFHTSNMSRPRYDSNAVLMLPAPLTAIPQPSLRNVISSSTIGGERRAVAPTTGSCLKLPSLRLRLIPNQHFIEQCSDPPESSSTYVGTPTWPRVSITGVNIPNLTVEFVRRGWASIRTRIRILGSNDQQQQISFPSSGDFEDSLGRARGIRLSV